MELRAACQQPWPSHMAAAALQLGLVEAWQALEADLAALFRNNDVRFLLLVGFVLLFGCGARCARARLKTVYLQS